MSLNRVRALLFIFLSLIMILIFRILYLQVFDGKMLAKSAYQQRVSNAQIEKPRGDIVDRNMIPFTNNKKVTLVALKPLKLRGKEDEIQSIASILNLEFNKIRREIDIKKESIIIETDATVKDKILKLGLEGVSVINTLKRYDISTPAKHILGYLNRVDQVGGAGIEKNYEKELQVKSQNKIGVVTDARNHLLEGIGYRLSVSDIKDKKYNVRLTLDYHIQQITERIMERNQITGAVVVEDVYSGDIVAVASKPDFDPNRIDKYLNSSNKELYNRATASYNLGSIFKIVDAAQGFESHSLSNEWYFCPGYIKIGDKEFKCSSYYSGGHGLIELKEAFASSCNPYFINMGINLGYKNIVEMAVKFGLGKATGVREQGVSEASGYIPSKDHYHLDGDTANIAIGQGDVMATPIQVADMIATIANGGMKNKAHIVDSIINSEGKILKSIRQNDGIRVISKDTSDKIKVLMEEVTNNGTGTKARLELYGGAAGKTGSAETGQFINGEKVVHAWFAGFFPLRNPKYSIAVFVENGKAGGEFAAPIFSQIAEEIMKKGL